MDVIVIGGGLAGLACASELHDSDVSCMLLEASDRVGGRVRTDKIDGFLLDRGFQVFLTAYPEARATLDYESLDLQRFEPGALIRYSGKFHRLSDPWRRPQHALSTLFSPVATLADKLRIARFRRDTTRAELHDIYNRTQQTTIELLRDRGFSDVIIDRFFRPFLGGVFLDGDLETSSRMCEFVFRMFSQGDAALPAGGMGEIPRQLANRLPDDLIRTDAAVASIEDTDVLLASGDRLSAGAVVVAVAAPVARQLLGDPYPADGRSVTCLYFAAPRPPIREAILVLNGDGTGPINNLCVPSQVSRSYAPDGQSLVSVTVLGHHSDEQQLLADVHKQLQEWYGTAVATWRHLKTYVIDYALPVQSPPALQPVAKPAQFRAGVFVCGDHCDTGSINGAMASGRRAAEAVIAMLQTK